MWNWTLLHIALPEFYIIGSDLKLWVDGLPISSRVTGSTKVLTDANACALFELPVCYKYPVVILMDN